MPDPEEVNLEEPKLVVVGPGAEYLGQQAPEESSREDYPCTAWHLGEVELGRRASDPYLPRMLPLGFRS